MQNLCTTQSHTSRPEEETRQAAEEDEEEKVGSDKVCSCFTSEASLDSALCCGWDPVLFALFFCSSERRRAASWCPGPRRDGLWPPAASWLLSNAVCRVHRPAPLHWPEGRCKGGGGRRRACRYKMTLLAEDQQWQQRSDSDAFLFLSSLSLSLSLHGLSLFGFGYKGKKLGLSGVPEHRGKKSTDPPRSYCSSPIRLV